MQGTVYLDHHATTPVDPRVVGAMLPCFTERFGNAGSVNHAYGEAAADAVERARAGIAAAIGAAPREIVFTSGATESNNLAIRGVCERHPRKGNHIVSVATEHRAVLDPLARLGRRGFDVTLLPVKPADTHDAGLVELDQLAAALRDDTLLVCVMLANNEIGAIQPLAEIGRLCRERGILLHSDATQAVGHISVDVDALGVDLMSFSAHKLYGPKGVGALYVRRDRGARLEPLINGGGQEHGLRSGTLNVPGIVGFGAAGEIAAYEMEVEGARVGGLRDRLHELLRAELPYTYLNGPALREETGGRGEEGHGEGGNGEEGQSDLRVSASPRPPVLLRLPGNLNLSFGGVDGEALMTSLAGLAVSSGSACTTADPEPSYVLRALGRSEALTRASLRFGVGRFNTVEEIERAAEIVIAAVNRLRGTR